MNGETLMLVPKTSVSSMQMGPCDRLQRGPSQEPSPFRSTAPFNLPFTHCPTTPPHSPLSFPLQVAESKEFVTSLQSCPKTGLHNPLKNVERYLMLGRVSDEASKLLRTPAVADFFAKLIMRTSPKSYPQAMAEVTIVAQFLDNFSGDNVRYLARSFAVPGDHRGQMSQGFRFPFGPVVLITPFNFPLEIPVLQLMGALYMGNKPLLKSDSRVSIVMEQFLRLLHSVGLPKEDVDMINSDGLVMNKLLLSAQPRMTQFTG